MSSNIRLKKICHHCKQSFIAQKTVTKFCSLTCAQRNYKKRLREEKITKVILETNSQLLGHHSSATGAIEQKSSDLKVQRDWISVANMAEVMGITERTLFRQIKNRAFPRLKIGRRLLLNKQQVIEFLTSKEEGL